MGRPMTKSEQTKVVYFEQTNGIIICSGIYWHSKQHSQRSVTRYPEFQVTEHQVFVFAVIRRFL